MAVVYETHGERPAAVGGLAWNAREARKAAAVETATHLVGELGPQFGRARAAARTQMGSPPRPHARGGGGADGMALAILVGGIRIQSVSRGAAAIMTTTIISTTIYITIATIVVIVVVRTMLPPLRNFAGVA